ncbi:hypothetical protein [Longimicrobium sp.]|uniref:hypothetical protein n=1 Tax=Longimicrobium sp. TaxID=2029185 RepID=UPI003B3BDA51
MEFADALRTARAASGAWAESNGLLQHRDWRRTKTTAETQAAKEKINSREPAQPWLVLYDLDLAAVELCSNIEAQSRSHPPAND